MSSSTLPQWTSEFLYALAWFMADKAGYVFDNHGLKGVDWTIRVKFMTYLFVFCREYCKLKYFTIIRWTSIKFCANTEATIGWLLAMTFGADIDAAKKMNPNDFGNPLTFPVVPLVSTFVVLRRISWQLVMKLCTDIHICYSVLSFFD